MTRDERQAGWPAGIGAEKGTGVAAVPGAAPGKPGFLGPAERWFDCDGVTAVGSLAPAALIHHFRR